MESTVSEFFTYHFVNDQVFNMGAVSSAAVLHGLLCGRLSAGNLPDSNDWYAIAQKYLDIEFVELNDEQKALFELVLEQTSSLIADDEYRFSLLLPGDEMGLQQRVNELGSWCEGYLHGLGQALGGKGESALSPDVADAMRDIAQITQVEFDENDDLDENESYWVELVEYVKVAVLNIYADLNNTDKPADPLH